MPNTKDMKKIVGRDKTEITEGSSNRQSAAALRQGGMRKLLVSREEWYILYIISIWQSLSLPLCTFFVNFRNFLLELYLSYCVHRGYSSPLSSERDRNVEKEANNTHNESFSREHKSTF